ncbi:MAG: flagellar basal body P-ring formation chaperone FlgA [Hyphomonadaceae bacterium]
MILARISFAVRPVIALAALGAALVAPAGAQEHRVTVAGDWVSLGDIAPVAGDAANILVAPSPPPGQTLALDPEFIVSVARKTGVVLALPANEPVWVTRTANPAGADFVAPSAPPPAVAASAPQAPAARQAPTIETGLAEQPHPDWILVLARDIERGRTLSADDLEWADPKKQPRARNPVTDAERAVGMAVRRSIRLGQPLQASDLETPDAVRKGEPVRLVYAARGLRISVDGVAQNDAAEGEGVRVLNTYTKRSVDAVATGAGEARVHARDR